MCQEPPKVPVCREGMVAVDLEEKVPILTSNKVYKVYILYTSVKVLMCGGNECGYVEPRKECWHLQNFNHTDGELKSSKL